MHSISITSVDDQPAAGKGLGSAPLKANHILTKEMIMKECVRQGYYRTPSCNEKLYLHHKGFDGIDPAAFKDYTDVKVLWLEGNCFSSLSCGQKMSAPPSAADNGTSSPAAIAAEVDAAEVSADAASESDQQQPTDDGVVDIFTPMYPTLRQLFLHGNIFNDMPNLQSFEKLDNINLSDNFISRIDAFCPHWAAAVAKDAAAAATNCDGEVRSPQKSAKSGGLVVASSNAAGPAASTVKRDAEALAALREQVGRWASRCKHERLDDVTKCLCSTLSTLTMKNNHLKTPEDIAALLCFKNLSVLDLSTNKIEDGDALLEILERLPNLKALQLSGNPCIRSITNYRKTVVARCKSLLYLDDRPVFDDERRLVTAWATGGLDAEKKERQLMKQEEEERHQRRLREFREMMAAARGDDALDTSTEDDTDSNPTPSSHSDDEGTAPGIANSNKSNKVNNKQRRSAATTANAPSGRVLSSNQRRGQNALPHTEFYEANYGSRSQNATELPPSTTIAADADAPTVAAAPTTQPGDGPNSVGFGNFRVVKKATTPAPVAAAVRRPPGKPAAGPGHHADPMQMGQIAVPSTLPPVDADDDDDDVEVWVPPPSK